MINAKSIIIVGSVICIQLCNLIHRLTLIFRKCLYKIEIYQFTVSIATVKALMGSVHTVRTASLQITDFILVTKYYNINSISQMERLARTSRKFPFSLHV